jgi:hypothetical protein
MAQATQNIAGIVQSAKLLGASSLWKKLSDNPFEKPAKNLGFDDLAELGISFPRYRPGSNTDEGSDIGFLPLELQGH